MTRKLFPVFLIGLLFCLHVPTTFAATVTGSTNDARITALDQKINFVLKLPTDNTTNYNGFQFTITYDPSILSVTDLNSTNSYPFYYFVSSGWYANDNVNGSITGGVKFFGKKGFELIPGSRGCPESSFLAQLPFTVKKMSGTSIRLSDFRLFDCQGNVIPVDIVQAGGIPLSSSSPDYPVTFQHGDHGTLLGETVQTVAEGQAASAVTAVPDEGYAFLGWTGDLESADNPLIISDVYAPRTVTAEFAPSAELATVTFQSQGQGFIFSMASQLVRIGEDAKRIFAIPYPGHMLHHWTDGTDVWDAERELTLTDVRKDMTLTAVFIPENDFDEDGAYNAEDDFPENDAKATCISASRPNKILVDVSETPNAMLRDVRLISPASADLNPSGKPEGRYFTDGLAGFTIRNNAGALDGPATVHVTFPSGIPETAMLSVVDADGFHELVDASKTGNTVTLSLMDGGPLDGDGASNGEVPLVIGISVPDTGVASIGIFPRNIFVPLSQDRFTVEIRVDHVLDEVGFCRSDILYDSTVLTYTDFAWGDFMTMPADSVTKWGRDRGFAAYVDAMRGPFGSGVVASMTFQVQERRDGTMELDKVSLLRPDNPNDVIMGSRIAVESLTASVVFERSEYGVTFQAGVNGRLEGNLAQTVTNGGNTTPVTAVPNDGYVFAGWTGVDTPDENPLVIENVTSDRVVTATFRAEDSGGGGGGGCFISSASDGSAWALLAAALFSLAGYRRF